MAVIKTEAKCIGINDFGQGLIKVGGDLYPVSNLLPKEVGLVEIDTENRTGKARLLKLLKTDASRQNPQCSIYDKCGSCQLLHMNYETQIRYKYDYVMNAFKEEKVPCNIDEIVRAENPLGYRNKMQVAFRYREGKVICGFYEEETHYIIPLSSCPVQTGIQNEIAKYVQTLMTKMKIVPYNEDRRTGIIRFVLIKEGFQSKQVLVVIVTNGELFPGRNEFVKQLKNRFPEITSIIQNYNSRQTSIILGDQERVLYGPGYIEDSLLGLKFKISSKTFFQINPAQTEKLYSKVREFADFHQTETIIDAYCGVGTIGMVLSHDVKQVIGVESNRQSVQNANANMKDNKISNMKFFNEDATEFLGKLAKDGEKIDAVIMDPPRSGSTEKFLNSILRLSPQKIIYVSCEAKTLARDLKSLIGNYKITKTAIVDMFPGTYHVECVALMSRAKE